ncbi:hypothetical protein [Actinokineospora sp. NBRC 105648]|uniref:hypothetical protein n=1 Tax=Actinokineospora sp. NBRC 105648 TaxID=3032206 RepID=UPI0024A09BC5|nr:hypothetical protein [Actinokineospora sp. NBRC 105648]GLZ42939.1 hypothetical protein Acsp05_65630 [Actinokineospora sp. NBRC 105648]
MGHITKARTAFCTTAAALALIVGATPALATNPAGVAGLGSATVVKNGVADTVPPLAVCAVDGQTSASSPGDTATGVKFGPGSSTCTTTVVDPVNSTTSTKSEATGGQFELSGLVLLGGPRVKINTYKVTCTATHTGTTVGWTFSGLSGLTGVPSPVPVNYQRELKSLLGVTLATITFNEVVLPSPNDGSIALNMAHVRFLPPSGVSGDVVVGATACSPTP